MNSQNSSISAIRSTESRMTSALVLTPRAFLARWSAVSSTKKDFRFSLVPIDITPPDRGASDAYILAMIGILVKEGPSLFQKLGMGFGGRPASVAWPFFLFVGDVSVCV